MLRRSRGRWLQEESDNDPLSGMASLIDIMLVFACGLIVALVMSWNLQDVLFKNVSQEEKQRLLEAIRQVVEVNMGEELEEIPEIQTDTSSGGTGFTEMGKVYQDPKTGKLILIQTEKAKGE